MNRLCQEVSFCSSKLHFTTSRVLNRRTGIHMSLSRAWCLKPRPYQQLSHSSQRWLKAPEAKKQSHTSRCVFRAFVTGDFRCFFVLLYHQDLAMMVGGSGWCPLSATSLCFQAEEKELWIGGAAPDLGKAGGPWNAEWGPMDYGMPKFKKYSYVMQWWGQTWKHHFNLAQIKFIYTGFQNQKNCFKLVWMFSRCPLKTCSHQASCRLTAPLTTRVHDLRRIRRNRAADIAIGWWFHISDTLWWTNIAMENHHAINGNIHYKWPFSIAMLVHQRVSGKHRTRAFNVF